MSRRKEILKFINEIIEQEHGNSVTEGSRLCEADIDSFATVMLFLELDGKYEAFPKEKFESLEFQDLTIKNIIDIIESKLDESN